MENFNLYPDVRSTDDKGEMRASRTQTMEFATVAEMSNSSRSLSPESRRLSWGGTRAAVGCSIRMAALRDFAAAVPQSSSPFSKARESYTGSNALHGPAPISSGGRPDAAQLPTSVAVGDDESRRLDLEAHVSGHHLSDANLTPHVAIAVEPAHSALSPQAAASLGSRPAASASMPREAEDDVEAVVCWQAHC